VVPTRSSRRTTLAIVLSSDSRLTHRFGERRMSLLSASSSAPSGATLTAVAFTLRRVRMMPAASTTRTRLARGNSTSLRTTSSTTKPPLGSAATSRGDGTPAEAAGTPSPLY
jgi:hypothetical protein